MPESAGASSPASALRLVGAPQSGAVTPAHVPAGDVVGEVVQALVPAPQPPGEAAPVFRAPIPQLPVQLAVGIPVHAFRVRQLLALAPGQVIETKWSQADDLPLAAGQMQIAWSVFEVVETRLAVRVTRLA